MWLFILQLSAAGHTHSSDDDHGGDIEIKMTINIFSYWEKERDLLGLIRLCLVGRNAAALEEVASSCKAASNTQLVGIIIVSNNILIRRQN